MSNLNDAQFGDYRGSHQAPGRDPDFARSAMHDPEDVLPGYPSDLKTAVRLYGHDMGGPVDRESHAAITSARGNPDQPVTVYRAAPKGANINPGDWVTPSRSYAQQHKISNGERDWTIAKATVPAKHLYSEGYISEWGYDPSE